jgi:hypothetical protein
MKAIGSSSPFSFFWVSMEAIVSSEENEYNMKSLSKSGLTRTRAVVIACLMSVKSL